jgi:hypothetical protein
MVAPVLEVQNGESECAHLPPWVASPYRLWSLWDMHRKGIAFLIDMCQKMDRLPAFRFMIDMSQPADRGYLSNPYPDEDDRLLNLCMAMSPKLKKVGLTTSAALMDAIRSRVEKPNNRSEDVLQAIQSFLDGLQAECNTKCFFLISSDRQECYEKGPAREATQNAQRGS